MKSTTTVWILADQLLEHHPAIEAAKKSGKPTILLIESAAAIKKRPYQQKKLVLLISAMRHYAELLRKQGYEVDYLQSATFAEGLHQHFHHFQPTQVLTMGSSDYSARQFQKSKLAKLTSAEIAVLPNTRMLVEQFSPYPKAEPKRHYIMENFYRAMRTHFDVLMNKDGSPVGSRWNFDAENRKPLPKRYSAPKIRSFTPDKTTRQVMDEVASAGHGVGSTEGFAFGVTHHDARQALDQFIEERLPDFGPYEDAMSDSDGFLNHSLLSAYVNLGLLDPMQMVRAAEDAYRAGKAPIHSVEGFIRQIIGWREYIYWQYWRQMPGFLKANSWHARRKMPKLFWSADTKMRCLHQTVRRVVDTGYSHHIERLMLVCNFCMLAGINPAEVSDWFLELYIDAYEWVVVPNVIGMGLNADSGQTATKPYVASANYINKMSDYCRSCEYDPKKRTGEGACPFNYLYWNFMKEHEDTLRSQPRLGPAVLGLGRIGKQEMREIQNEAHAFLKDLK